MYIYVHNTMVAGIFPGVKASGAWLWPPTPYLGPRLKKT